MAVRHLPLAALEPHPENANRMPPALLAKLRDHLARTGRYEPLVVRPLSPVAGAPPGAMPRYQILNGHHRARVLADLGHTHARCDVWEVDDTEARLLLATLNRLEGRDDPHRRAALVARLGRGRSDAALARLLPEPTDAVARLRALATPPPGPADPGALAPPLRPMTVFLTPEQDATVKRALGAAPVAKAPDVGGARAGRAERLAAVAAAYLAAAAREAEA